MNGVTCPKCGAVILKRGGCRGAGGMEYYCPNCDEYYQWNNWEEYYDDVNKKTLPIPGNIADHIRDALALPTEDQTKPDEPFNPSFRRKRKKNES